MLRNELLSLLPAGELSDDDLFRLISIVIASLWKVEDTSTANDDLLQLPCVVIAARSRLQKLSEDSVHFTPEQIIWLRRQMQPRFCDIAIGHSPHSEDYICDHQKAASLERLLRALRLEPFTPNDLC